MHCDRWFAWSTGPVALLQSDITNRQSISSRGVQTYVGRVKIPPFFRASIGRYLSSLSCGGVQARRWKRNFAPRGKPPPNAPKRRRETAPVASADAANCRPTKIPELFSLSELHVCHRLHEALRGFQTRAQKLKLVTCSFVQRLMCPPQFLNVRSLQRSFIPPRASETASLPRFVQPLAV
jgi:hypothetical protein